MTRSSVLHISAAEGGGADRYIRDLAANTPRPHFLWHVGSGIDVIEDLAAHRFSPLSARIENAEAAPALHAWLRKSGIGIIHLHGLGAACRSRLALVRRTAPTPWMITLHDLTFVDPNAFSVHALQPDAAWIAELAATLADAVAAIAPSRFVQKLASQHFPRLPCTVVAPGIDLSRAGTRARAPEEFVTQRPKQVVAVVGALGPHKGSALLDPLADRLANTDVGIVVIGYTDSQLLRGWRVPGHCYVHGPYLDADLPALLEAYRVELALFPNRLPESFSYTLSEVWAAGIPVIVPEDGALLERVSQHGGGWILPAGFSAEDAALLLQRLLAPAGAVERARVKSRIDRHDASRIPTLAAMARDIDALYERFGLKPPSGESPAAASEALRPLLAANLDGFAFRKELLKFADEAAQLRAGTSKLECDIHEAQAWARKLEHDVEALAAEGKALFEENRRLADDKAAFDQLPRLIRKLLLKKALRARG
ncbi:MAG TPA: glycosyltransferase family 4 protein [Casimicrobiaceae bacterium]